MSMAMPMPMTVGMEVVGHVWIFLHVIIRHAQCKNMLKTEWVSGHVGFWWNVISSGVSIVWFVAWLRKNIFRFWYWFRSMISWFWWMISWFWWMISWFRRMICWFWRMISWFRRMISWFWRMISWFRRMIYRCRRRWTIF